MSRCKMPRSCAYCTVWARLAIDFCRASQGDSFAPNELIELPAFLQFHAEVARAVALTDLVDRDNAGCSRLAAASASRRKRFKCVSVAQCPSAITFSATIRFRLFWRAR